MDLMLTMMDFVLKVMDFTRKTMDYTKNDEHAGNLLIPPSRAQSTAAFSQRLSSISITSKGPPLTSPGISSSVFQSSTHCDPKS